MANSSKPSGKHIPARPVTMTVEPPRHIPVGPSRGTGTASWTIKSVPVAVREKAIRYARMDGVTVSEWMTRAVETEANRQDGNQIIPPARAMPETPPALDLGTVAAALSAMAQAQAAGLPVTKAAGRETVALIREHVRVGRGLPAKQTRRQIGQTINQDIED